MSVAMVLEGAIHAVAHGRGADRDRELVEALRYREPTATSMKTRVHRPRLFLRKRLGDLLTASIPAAA